MPETALTVLLIEDNPGDARLVKEALADLGHVELELEWAPRLADGLDRLGENQVDLVLLDLSLPDCNWKETLSIVHHRAPQVPIVVLTGIEDEGLAAGAVQQGAQDFVIKGDVDARTLERTMRYAIERQRTLSQLRAMSLTDELTGLYNRRGFVNLADRQMALAARTGWRLMLLFADLDGLKHVNDRFGHAEGDLFLTDMAGLLKHTFRASDVVARVGGDEFAVLAIDTPADDGEPMLRRLRRAIESHNAKAGRQWTVAASIGVAHYNPANPRTLGELLDEADAMMYEQKRARPPRP